MNFNRAQSVSLEFVDPKVIKVSVVHSARKEIKATRVLTAKREMFAKRANVDLKDYKEQPDWRVLKVILVSQDHQEHRVSVVLPAPRVFEV